MKKILISIVFATLLVSSFGVIQVQAQTMEGGCTAIGQCVNNKKCVLQNEDYVVRPDSNSPCGSAQLGSVKPPAAYTNIATQVGGSLDGAKGKGLIIFMSRLINLFVIICGIWTMFNFLYAGYILISSQSDSKAMTTVRESLTMTAVGLAIIAGAYILAGVIGLIFFGDASYILSPTVTSALDMKP